MKRFHTLAGNKRIEIPRYSVYFDSESVPLLQPDGSHEHKPYLLCACFRDRRVVKEKWRHYHKHLPSLDDGEWGGDIGQFWSELAEWGDKKGSVYLYAHNAFYDLVATAGVKGLCNAGYRVTNFFEKGNTFLMTFKRDKKIIHIVSSTNYFATTLEQLGKIFNLPKGDIDYFKEDIPAALPYCKRDVEICKKAVETFTQFVDDEELGTLAKTTPGQAFNAFRTRFMSHLIHIHDNEKATKLEREAYGGGRVECWRIGEYQGQQFFGYDVNSMYPYTMLTDLYPTKLLSFNRYSSLPKLKKILTDGLLICAKVKIKTDKPYYALKTDKSLIFTIGEFWTTLSTPELKHAVENNLIVAVKEVAIYQGERIFQQYVDYFYNKRLAAKAEKNLIYDMLYKLFMNSLYGKFGQQSESWEDVGACPSDIVKAYEIWDAETGQRKNIRMFGGTIFEKSGEVSEAFNSFCAVAAHVTAAARMLLVKYIDIAGWDEVLYMDTDSLFTTQDGSDRLFDAGIVSNTELGALKLEKSDDKITINCPKDYSFAKVKKVKGIKKGSKRLLLHKHKWEIEDDYTTTVWPKLGGFLRSGQLDTFRNKSMVKTLTRTYGKGWVTDTGNVLPFVMLTKGNTNYIQDPEKSYPQVNIDTRHMNFVYKNLKELLQ